MSSGVNEPSRGHNCLGLARESVNNVQLMARACRGWRNILKAMIFMELNINFI